MPALKNLTIKLRLTLLTAFALLLLIILSVISVSAINQAAKSLDTVYHDRLIPTGQLGRIQQELQNVRAELLLSFQHDPSQPLSSSHDHPVNQHLEEVNGSLKRVDTDWKAYLSTYLTPEEKQLADQANQQLGTLLNQGTTPTLAALQRQDYANANRILLTSLQPAARELDGTLERMLELQVGIAEQEYQKGRAELPSNSDDRHRNRAGGTAGFDAALLEHHPRH